MNTPPRSSASLWILALAASAALTGCSSDRGAGGAGAGGSEPDSLDLLLASVSPVARTKMGIGDPRSGGYWVVWSTCGEGSRAETAAANGGREAGWILLDDLLEDPGIILGEWPVTTCEDAIAVLQGDTSDPVSRLARQVLAAELNRTAGSGTCGAASEAVLSGQALLARQSYGGSDAEGGVPELDAAESMARAAALLSLYNGGRLCR